MESSLKERTSRNYTNSNLNNFAGYIIGQDYLAAYTLLKNDPKLAKSLGNRKVYAYLSMLKQIESDLEDSSFLLLKQELTDILKTNAKRLTKNITDKLDKTP